MQSSLRNAYDSNKSLAIAVGTIIAERPPHSPNMHNSRIRLPPWMTSVKAFHRIRMQNVGNWNPAIRQPVEADERYAATLTSA